MHMSVARSRTRHRALTGAVALAAAAALALVADTGAVAQGSTRSAEECATTSASHLRVRPGSAQGEDPNSVSARRAATAQRKLVKRVGRMQAAGTLSKAGGKKGGGPVTIKTWVHVITKKNGTGGVAPWQVKKQVAVLNKAFAGRTAGTAAPSPIRFALAGTTVTKNDKWHDWGLDPQTDEDDAEAMAAKRALHKGGMNTLNIYVASLEDGLLGYATFPWDRKGRLDGVVVLNESLPGGDSERFNLGDTGTHEVGHWLGLFHTFENGCNPPGDYIKDTPAQDDGDNVFYCGDNPEFGRDTCPQPGKDPIHNFMSYGDDPCLNKFTPEQAKRMTQVWFGFRRGR